MKIELSPAALKFAGKLKRGNPRDMHAITRRLSQLEDDPKPPGARKMAGYDGEYWRITVGDYRLIYAVAETGVYIWTIARRNDLRAYREFKRSLKQPR